MATDLTIGEKAKTSRLGSFCSYAQQCLWFETTAQTSQVCANRNTLACQKRRDEVFGQEAKLGDQPVG
jgi:hypothetical protein